MEKTSLLSARSLRILPFWIYVLKNSSVRENLGADIISVTFPEYFILFYFILFLFLITFIQSTINNQKYLQTLRYLHYLQYNI